MHNKCRDLTVTKFILFLSQNADLYALKLFVFEILHVSNVVLNYFKLVSMPGWNVLCWWNYCLLRIDRCFMLHFWEIVDCNYLLEFTVGQSPSDNFALLSLVHSKSAVL